MADDDVTGVDDASEDTDQAGDLGEGEESTIPEENLMPDGSESTGLEDESNIPPSIRPDSIEALGRPDNGDVVNPQNLPELPKSEEEKAGDERARSAQLIVGKERRQLDKTIPGGLVMSRSGRLHNAHGQRVTEQGRPITKRPDVRPSPESGTRKLGS